MHCHDLDGFPMQTHPYMAGQPLPAGGFGELGAPDDLNLTLKNMTLNDLILKEFSFQLEGKMEFFRRSSRVPKRRERKTSTFEKPQKTSTGATKFKVRAFARSSRTMQKK